MSESKKRPHADDDEIQQHKKRVLTGLHGSPRPQVNGTDSGADEPTDTDGLELFRKEAIYRRMKHYSREQERSQLRIAELEQRKNTCEAGLVAIAACWEQLVNTIQTLVEPSQLPAIEVETSDLFDLTRHVSNEPGLKAALEQNMHATQKLVTSFLQLGEGSRSLLLNDETYQRCQKSQTECTVLRSEMALLQTRLRDLQSEKEKYHDDLIRAEVRADRLRSDTVQAMHNRPPQEKQASKDLENGENGEESVKQASPSPPLINGHDQHAPDYEDLKHAVKSKGDRVAELEEENARLLGQIHSLELELKSPAEATITETPYYKILFDHASRLETTIRENETELSKVNETLFQLQASRQEFEEETRAAAGQANQELTSMLTRRDKENVHLRDQRDQHAAELNERKQKETVKMNSYHELKALSESRSERIKALEAEVKRLKAQLAANAGDEDLMKFFFGNEVEDTTYINDLKSKLRCSEEKVAALKETLSSLQKDHPDLVRHTNNEAEVRQQLAEIKKQLERYQSTFGEAASSDLHGLTEQLQRKEEEIQQLRVVQTQQKEAEASLYEEIDKLSGAWEGLGRQVASKTFDLQALEERLAKVNHEKAKCDNKYYTSIREKDAIENERKNLVKNTEKQLRFVDKAKEAEKLLQAQVSELEKEIVNYRQASLTLNAHINTLEKEVSDWKHRAEFEKKRCSEARTFAMQKEQAHHGKQSEIKRLEDEMQKTTKEFERQAAKLKSVNSGPSTLKEEELESEVERLKQALKCTTCRQRFRNTVITKCMHTFCKECVDARISTRQRKCPACNLGFAQSEVHTIYFQ